MHNDFMTCRFCGHSPVTTKRLEGQLAKAEAELELVKAAAEARKEEELPSYMRAVGNSVPTWPSKETLLLDRIINTLGDVTRGDAHLPTKELETLLLIYAGLRLAQK
jgi:hypothetical protein